MSNSLLKLTPKNHAPPTLHRENHAGESAKPAGLLRTRRQSI